MKILDETPKTELEIKQAKFIQAFAGFVLRQRQSDALLTAQLKAIQEGGEVDLGSKVILNAPDHILQGIANPEYRP